MEKYKTILIDPPWPERGGGKIKRGADRHYQVLSVAEIPKVILSSGVFNPDDNCHLYFWTTNNYLPSAIKIVEELGFRYITLLTWAKPKFGIGQYFRGQTEHIIFAVKGKGLDLRKSHTNRANFPTVLNVDYRRDENNKIIHSGKPEESYKLIEEASPGPRLEMFARRQRDGWDVWGLEVKNEDTSK